LVARRAQHHDDPGQGEEQPVDLPQQPAQDQRLPGRGVAGHRDDAQPEHLHADGGAGGVARQQNLVRQAEREDRRQPTGGGRPEIRPGLDVELVQDEHEQNRDHQPAGRFEGAVQHRLQTAPPHHGGRIGRRAHPAIMSSVPGKFRNRARGTFP